MNECRILALNDDNHETCFCDEYGFRYHTHMEFIRRLARPHNVNHNIRCVYICNIPEDMDNDFDAVQVGRKDISYREAFERLWAISKEDMFV